jgi:uroporphyrinogen decarboxylase
VDRVRAARPSAKIIGFPRAATLAGYQQYARETGVDAVSIDTSAPPAWAAERLSTTVSVQGNLDPIALVAGGDALVQATASLLEAMRGKPFVFNLGHGVLPDTPLEHVAALIAQVRAA